MTTSESTCFHSIANGLLKTKRRYGAMYEKEMQKQKKKTKTKSNWLKRYHIYSYINKMESINVRMKWEKRREKKRGADTHTHRHRNNMSNIISAYVFIYRNSGRGHCRMVYFSVHCIVEYTHHFSAVTVKVQHVVA